mmetsp:Transcript_1723/g.2275  ORF Transcript_1723/g.2275 Transcript_1723/m.2275 type:complete len:521 (-) Transcript_1723:3444-5006(-)
MTSQDTISGKSIEDDEISYDQSIKSAEVSVDTKDSELKHDTKKPLLTRLKKDFSISEGIIRFRAHWKVIVAGQLISFFMAFAGALTSTIYYDCNLSFPSLQLALVFFVMSLFLIEHAKQLKQAKQKQAEEKRGLSMTKTRSGRQFYSIDARGNKLPKIDENADNLSLGQSVSIDSFDHRNDIPTSEHTEEAAAATTHPQLFWGRFQIQLTLSNWVYFFLALVLVEATYFGYLALSYTDFMSAAILDNLNIVAAMVMSRLILKRRYSWSHVLGALICIIGTGLNLISDYEESNVDISDVDDKFKQQNITEYPYRSTGDMLAIFGGILFGCGDVFIEIVVKEFSGFSEYVGMIGFYGAIIAGIQAIILDRNEIAKMFSSQQILSDDLGNYENNLDAPRTCPQSNAFILLGAYVFVGFIFNWGLAKFLKVSEAALLTISLLTSDLWAVFFTVVIQHVSPSLLFYVAFVTVLVGVLVYEMSPSPLGNAEDLQIHKDIEMEVQQDPFEISNISLSWDSHNSREVV